MISIILKALVTLQLLFIWAISKFILGDANSARQIDNAIDELWER